MKNLKLSKFNDGVVFFYRDTNVVSDFNAKRNNRTLETLTFICKMMFEELSKRSQDIEFANQNSFILNSKIKCRKLNTIDNKCKAVINNKLYDISFIDSTKTEMFLYLSGGIAL